VVPALTVMQSLLTCYYLSRYSAFHLLDYHLAAYTLRRCDLSAILASMFWLILTYLFVYLLTYYLYGCYIVGKCSLVYRLTNLILLQATIEAGDWRLLHYTNLTVNKPRRSCLRRHPTEPRCDQHFTERRWLCQCRAQEQSRILRTTTQGQHLTFMRCRHLVNCTEKWSMLTFFYWVV